MRNFLLGLTTATLILGASAATGEAGTLRDDAVYRTSDAPLLQDVQFFWSGRHYCWYDGGWHGPGWYWCGYAFRRGFGWGGGFGWHGWHGGGSHGGGFHGGHGGHGNDHHH